MCVCVCVRGGGGEGERMRDDYYFTDPFVPLSQPGCLPWHMVGVCKRSNIWYDNLHCSNCSNCCTCTCTCTCVCMYMYVYIHVHCVQL